MTVPRDGAFVQVASHARTGYGHDMRIFVLGLFLIMACPAAVDARDALTAAVAFALTGSDGADVVALDLPRCVFVVNPKVVSGRRTGDTYYLNDVEVDRLRFEPQSNAFSKWVQVELHGVGAVYGFTAPPPKADKDSFLSDDVQGKLAALSKPRSAKDWTLKVYTTEQERLARAWAYLYAHGCHGAGSPF